MTEMEAQMQEKREKVYISTNDGNIRSRETPRIFVRVLAGRLVGTDYMPDSDERPCSSSPSADVCASTAVRASVRSAKAGRMISISSSFPRVRELSRLYRRCSSLTCTACVSYTMPIHHGGRANVQYMLCDKSSQCYPQRPKVKGRVAKR